MTVINDDPGQSAWDNLVIEFRDTTGEDPFAKDPEPLKSAALLWVHQLLDDANDAIRWLLGDFVAKEIEDTYEIEISNAEGQEIFKAALENGATEAPFPPNCLQAIARAFGVGEDL